MLHIHVRNGHTSTYVHKGAYHIIYAGFLYLLIAVEQRSLFQFGYWSESPNFLHLFCRGLNIVAVQRPLNRCCCCAEASTLILLLCRGLCSDILRPLPQCFCCAEASIPILVLRRGLCRKVFLLCRGLCPYVAVLHDYCPDVVVVQGLLSQCCCHAEAFVSRLLLYRGLCPDVVVGQRPLS